MYEPIISLLVETKTKTDQEKLEAALRKLAGEDPTFRWETDSESGKTTVSGMGELHLEIILDKILREFQVAVSNDKPRVIYKRESRVVLVEPIMRLEVVMPTEDYYEVRDDLFARRGMLSTCADRKDMMVIEAEVPLAECLGYADTLRVMTRGRATFTMQFDRYEVVPPSIARKIPDSAMSG